MTVDNLCHNTNNLSLLQKPWHFIIIWIEIWLKSIAEKKMNSEG